MAAFATGVYALDEMTLDSVKKRLPSIRNIAEAVLPGKTTALFDVRTQIWHALEFQEKAHQNEKVAARDMLKYIPRGSLILADLGTRHKRRACRDVHHVMPRRRRLSWSTCRKGLPFLRLPVSRLPHLHSPVPMIPADSLSLICHGQRIDDPGIAKPPHRARRV